MYVFILANFLVIPLLVMAHPNVGNIVKHTFTPGIAGGANSTSVLLIIAIVGTTVAPWQLFFQQSNIIDKRITPRWINYERADTVIGAFIVVIGAAAIIAIAAFAFMGTPEFGHFIDAGAVARGLARHLGSTAGTFFAIVLLNASLIGAAAVTLSTSYAFGDVFGAKHSLNRGPLEAKFFYASFAVMVAAAAGIVLIPHAPLGLITTSVQALAGVLLPSATVFLLLLTNDREVLGPWVNPPWLNAIASVIVGVLVELSLILVASTAFPSVNVVDLFVYLSVALVLVLAGMAAYALRNRATARRVEVEPVSKERRSTWTMPPLALLERPAWSPGRRAAMLLLRAYLLVAVLLLIVKTIQLGH
jgi:Mn2+/Fe2+ NRAMP family transporter